ncbi:MAG TPA: hypothetical protein VJO35_02125 [Terriglobales bacterium]|nr:hypothetical protein [Terriglobales bacterium]
MGKFSSFISLLAVIVSCALLPSCGSSSPTTVTAEIPPTGVTIAPSPVVSLEVGKTQVFAGGPTGHTFVYQSSNPAVLTIANNGLACAGTWNSLTAPQVCTPGQPGTATVTATAQGVTSPAVTVYVHEPVTSITISKVPGQQTVSDSCLSRGAVHGPESWLFEANAFNGSRDITATVGPFSWQQINPNGATNVLSLSSVPAGAQGCLLGQGQCLNEESVAAGTPGLAQINASVGGFSSNPIRIETCRVKSISIAANGDVPTDTSFLVTTGSSTTLNATITDIANQTITGVPLTWSTSDPSAVSVSATGAVTSTFGSTNSVASPGAGVGTVIASCTPPACNSGFSPSLPIYPQAAFSFNVQAASTSTATIPTVYATTTACTDPAANPAVAACMPTLVPITKSSATAAFTAGTPVVLPTTPNSFLFDHNGGSAYLGVNSSQFGQQGLMIFSGSSVAQATTVPGKVVAISPDNNIVITADTVDSPNQILLCTNCGASGRTVTPIVIPAGVSENSVSAAFSPDSLKAYIVTQPVASQPSTLYFYSRVDPLQTLQLSGPANDVIFHPEGGFAYVAGPASSITPYRNCDSSQLSSANLSTANPPLMLRALPDGTTLLALEPPNIDVISVSLFTSAGLCSATLTDTITSLNLGQGSFIPTQLFFSPSGTTAYILAETSAGPPPSRLPFVLTFNLNTRTSSEISLADNAIPLSASLSPDGTLLFVGANDGAVHVIETASGLDTQQVTFPFPTNELCFGPGNPATQVPLDQLTISAVSASGSDDTYSYALISGPALKVGQSVTISGMSNGGDNGTFTIGALGTDASGNPTFTVSNSNGVTASGQSGLGTVPVSCNPDLVVVKP